MANTSAYNDPYEILTNAEMAQADQLAICRGDTGDHVDGAGRGSCCRCCRQLLEKSGGSRVTILCGPGNNGGDGFVAARILKTMGYTVSAGLLGKLEQLNGDAALAAAAWAGRTGSAALVDLENADLVIDALFGTGLSRPVEGRARSIIERVNSWRQQTGRPVLAVDIPSGLDGDTGAVLGVSIVADRSVTFFRLKLAHVLLPAVKSAAKSPWRISGFPRAYCKRFLPRFASISRSFGAAFCQYPDPADTNIPVATLW